MQKTSITICILNYNGAKDTLRCLKSLIKNSNKNIKILVGDNNSSGSDIEFLKRHIDDPRISYVKFEKNYGYSGGHNRLARIAKSEYVILLNNDTIVTKDWIKPLLAIFKTNKKAAAAQPKILSLNKKRYFDYAGACGGQIDIFGYPFTKGRIFNTQEEDNGQYDKTSKLIWASGAVFMIKRKIFLELGGFDESFFNYMEEIDLCFRILRAGYEIYCEPKSKVFHKGAATASKNLFKKRFWEHRNSLLLYVKNYPLKYILLILPIRIVLELISVAYYIASGQYTYAKAAFTSLISFFILSPKYIFNRLKTKPFFTREAEELIYKGSIALDYFILKKKQIFNPNKNREISYIIFYSSVNTGNKVVFEQTNAFIKKGYKVNVYYLFGKKENWFPLKTDVKNFWRFIFKKHDILIATFWPTAFLIYFIKAEKKFYFIQGKEEDFYSNKILKKLVRISYSFNYKMIVISNFLKSYLLEINVSNSIYKIDNSIIDTKIFFRKPNYQKKYNDFKKIKILFVISWYNKAKGHDISIRIINMIKKKYPNTVISIATRENKKLSANFDFFICNPKQQQMADLYQENHFLISLSRSEGLYIPGIEAISCGCIFITTDSGGVAEYAINGKTAILIKKPEDIINYDILNKIISNKKIIKLILKNSKNSVYKYNKKNILKPLEKILTKKNN